ncbi:MAG: hypothetical protein SGBAC_008137 [Bacillariaceae sp.]
MSNSLSSLHQQYTEQSQQNERSTLAVNGEDIEVVQTYNAHANAIQAAAPGASDSPANIPSNSTTNFNLDRNTFSLCLLLKDDNDILNEWIAYHYHTLNLRYMIVALDPFSQTSPEPIFEKWRSLFGMTIEVWTDKDYMPDFFLQGRYDQVDSFIPQFVNQDKSKSIWHTDTSNASQVEQDLIHINNHRFRQVTFVSHCFEFIKNKLPDPSSGKKGKKQPEFQHWVGHIDTDEYIVINPVLRDNPNRVKLIEMPHKPTAGSVLQFLMELFEQYAKRLSRSCFMIPTLLFGAQIHDDWTHEGGIINFTATIDTDHWNVAHFETLRWRIHADYSNIINGLQKAILDLSHLPSDHEIFKNHRIKSVHMPLDKGGTHGCRQMSLRPDIHAVRLFPLSINHYVGSRERYLSRHDKRRNIEIYDGKARVNGGVDDGWIRGWLPSFVQDHGLEKASQVLGDYRMP